MSLFYKPADGWLADVIPFFWQGVYHLFYLKDFRDASGHGEGTPWCHLTTTDFVRFDDHGEILARGRRDEQDLYVFTGSVIEHAGQFHIFYTGHNPHFEPQGKPVQGVMHAVSDDLYTWRKVPQDTFYAPADRYEPHDWRDPFVFWDDEAGEWSMLLAARLKEGPSRRRGCTALCSSADLKRWHVCEPFWSPALYFTHECPDLFRIGDWWYLLFSEFSEACVTRYRMSRSLHGPWLAPANDTFDGRAFYAAKTATDGFDRFLFGWNPTREGETDEGRWQWGGHMVAHRLRQQSDGTLGVEMPETVQHALRTQQAVAFTAGVGNVTADGDSVRLASQGRFSCAAAGALPHVCHIQASATFAEGTRNFGLMLRTSDDFETGYTIRFEPAMQRLAFDSWPRPGDKPAMCELERPMRLQAGEPLEINVLIDGSVCEVYAGGSVAMSARLYNHPRGQWGVFAGEGDVRFEQVSLKTT
jgi:beta-fructofuranosidase